MYLQFDFEKKYSPSKFERFLANSEIQRYFSLGLSDFYFSSGSRRYFLVSLEEMSLRSAARLTVWINYKETDSHWSPDKVDIYKPIHHIDLIPEVGALENHFEKINSFKFSGETLSLHTDVTCLSTLSLNYLESLSFDTKVLFEDKTTFYDSLLLSLIEENLWVSVFIKPTWSSFNRSARLTTALLSMSLMSLSNMMWYGQDRQMASIEIGPIQFTPSTIYIAIVQAIFVALPTLFFINLFQKTAPISLSNYS